MGRHKLTPWFDGAIDPVRAGWYDTLPGVLGPFRRYWNGSQWRTELFGLVFKGGVDAWRGEAQPRNSAVHFPAPARGAGTATHFAIGREAGKPPLTGTMNVLINERLD